MRTARCSTVLAAALCLVPAAHGAMGSTGSAPAPSAPRSPLIATDDGTLILAAPAAAAAGAPLRRFVDLRGGDAAAPPRARAAMAHLRDRHGAWQASWDQATGVPARLWGPPIEVPGSVADPAIAAAAARATLADHLALLAPGASLDDFTLVSNDLDRGMRSIGFTQSAGGVPVLGGQVSFRFKNDRLFVIGSEALPSVPAPGTAAPHASRAPSRDVRAAAVDWIARAVSPRATLRTADDAAAILPLVGERGVLAYRTVRRVVVDTVAPVGRWAVYVDDATAAVVAREQLLSFGVGQVRYDTPIRHPLGERAEYPAARAALRVDGAEQHSDPSGMVTWGDELQAEITARASGELVDVINDLGDPDVKTLALSPDGAATWDARDDITIDAQVTVYIHANLAKDRARRFFAEELDYLDQVLEATVNQQDGDCNAFSTGDDIHFYHEDDVCQNTGTMPDVIYHEFGHSIHSQSVIPGVGRFDSSMSEGMSDYFSATITNDSGMGRGFFYDDDALRDLDPAGYEYRWPEDVGEVHHAGQIIGGAMWDVRKAMIARLGFAAGVDHADRLYYAALRRAANMPTCLVELLAADDDNGDLTDGTPYECDLRDAFASHGLRDLAPEVSGPGQVVTAEGGLDVTVRLPGLSPRCPIDELDGLELAWRARGDTTEETAPMTLADDTWSATIVAPARPGVFEYQVRIAYDNGEVMRLPENPSDAWFELYVGEVIPLYCTGFETDPFAEGWLSAVTTGEVDQWQWGEPSLDTRTSFDPSVPLEGERVVGTNLADAGVNHGFYLKDTASFFVSPELDVGAYSDVRLQYRRWLNVEDAYYDHATIASNGHQVWEHVNSDQGEDSALHHWDREWRFHDVPLGAHIRDGTVRVRFGLDTDGGLQFGGWNLDDLCVVAAAGAICGDGELQGQEQCDDGDANADAAGACRTSCHLPICGDAIVDDDEECDDGNDDDEDDCRATCTLAPPALEEGCGCDGGGSTGGRGAAFALGAALVAFALRRRRA